MSIKAVAWALDCQFRDDPYAKLILIALANHADHITGFCWPSMRQIGHEASCDRRTVIRRLPELESAGFIRIVRGHAGSAHVYQLLMPGCDPQTHPPTVNRAASKPARRCLSVTPPCDSVVTQNHHSTINIKPLSQSVPAVGSKRLGNERVRTSATTLEHSSIVQARVAEKLGNGDVASGWMLLGDLSESDRDQLTAQERSGNLTAPQLARFLSRRASGGAQ
ncbi:hypothetical protein ABIE88_006255 [Bradyrhizobium diazoefficiens]